MLTKNTPINALIITLITGVIGLTLFFGSVHGGGTPFYLGMVFLPPLYLLYADLVPFNNLLVIITIALFIQYIFWMVILYGIKKVLGSNNELSKTI